MFEDMDMMIDDRIKYHRCKTGQRSGTLKATAKVRGRNITRTISWLYPGVSEVSAVNQLTTWLMNPVKPE